MINWQAAGIEAGDILLIHSRLRRLIKEENETPQSVLKSLLDHIGNGTVLFPLFNFGWTLGVPFDIRSTPSKMGVLTEAARRHPAAIRSGHPLYSFACIGSLAESFAVDNFTGYGPDSPFAILKKYGGKIAVLDLDDQHSMTFYHHVEDMHEVPYRYHKQFHGKYTDGNGKTTWRTYQLFVRKEGIATSVNGMQELLWDQGLYTGNRQLRSIRADAMFEAVSDVIKSGKAEGLLYERR